MTEPFVFANGQVAYNAEDLIKICQEFPDDSVPYLIHEDFEKWLKYIGATKIAEYAHESRQTAIADRQKLDTFIAKIKTASQPQPEISPETPTPATEESKPQVNLFAALAGFLIVLFRGRSDSDQTSTNT